MKSPRLTFDKPSYYSNNVLLGNWVEERFDKYKKNHYNHTTIYKQDFTPPSALDKKENDDRRNDTKIKSEYCDHILSSKVSDEVANHFDNFTTTYDLSYKYFPEWVHGSVDRKLRFKLLKYEPTDEYLDGFGNLSTRNNLADYKKETWVCDVLDPRRSVSTVSKADYIKYDSEAYKHSKWPRLHPEKTKCGTGTDMLYKQLPANHPRSLESKRNPITWDSPDENDSPQNCVCQM